MEHISGWAMLVDMILIFGFGASVAVIFVILSKFFTPFRKLVELLINADKY